MPYVESGSATLWFESYGSGPAVVLCHGAGGNAASWYQQIPAFEASGMRVIAIDHRGFGRSTCAEEDFDPVRFPSDLCAVLDACRVERASLVCQSMGGWTGLPMALAHADRVCALVLCGTPAGLSTPEITMALADAGRRIAERGSVGAPGGPALGRSFQEKEPVRAFLYSRIASFNVALPQDALARLGRVRIVPEQLLAFSIPTLVVAGDEDVLFPPAALRSVARSIPGAGFVEISGAGHSTYFEQPERFNSLVLAFLSESAQSGPEP